VDPEVETAVVLAAIRAELRARYSFERRDFGQDVVATDLIQAIQNVVGVAGVRLEALFLAGLPRARLNLLRARAAVWGPDGVRAAQLPRLDGESGVKLDAVTL